MKCKNCGSSEIGIVDAEIRVITNQYSGTQREEQSLHCVFKLWSSI